MKPHSLTGFAIIVLIANQLLLNSLCLAGTVDANGNALPDQKDGKSIVSDKGERNTYRKELVRNSPAV
jgi:hypothetical protein